MDEGPSILREEPLTEDQIKMEAYRQIGAAFVTLKQHEEPWGDLTFNVLRMLEQVHPSRSQTWGPKVTDHDVDLVSRIEALGFVIVPEPERHLDFQAHDQGHDGAHDIHRHTEEGKYVLLEELDG